jgi:uncharacterized protein
LLNKAILVPAALAISAFAPWAVTPLLVLGGLFLCFEGFEKLAHKHLGSRAEEEGRRAALSQALADPNVDMAALERDKIKGAVRTDFVLSAEIIAITLGTVAQAPFLTQVLVLCGIGALMTVGVYGLVAAIVKLDDLGLWMSRRAGVAAGLGRAILASAPWLMKALSVAGTAAMFLVGGGILTHGLPFLHRTIELATTGLQGASLGAASMMADALAGLLAGALVLACVVAWRALRRRLSTRSISAR